MQNNENRFIILILESDDWVLKQPLIVKIAKYHNKNKEDRFLVCFDDGYIYTEGRILDNTITEFKKEFIKFYEYLYKKNEIIGLHYKDKQRFDVMSKYMRKVHIYGKYS